MHTAKYFRVRHSITGLTLNDPLADRAIPKNVKPDELRDYEEITWKAIKEAVKPAKD